MKQQFRRLTDDDKTEMMRGLNWAAIDVEKNWLAADYPPAMQSDRAQFRHAHVHATKALGKIAALVDHMDHERDADEEAQGLIADLPKLLADLIRCTAKMAERRRATSSIWERHTTTAPSNWLSAGASIGGRC